MLIKKVPQGYVIEDEDIGGRIHLSANQIILPGVWTLVNLDTIDYDWGGNFNIALHRFVASIPCYVLAIGNCGWALGTQNDKLYCLMLKRVGTAIAEGAAPAGLMGASPDGPNNTVSDIIQLQIGQYVDMWVYNGGTANATIEGISYNTFMDILFIRRG